MVALGDPETDPEQPRGQARSGSIVAATAAMHCEQHLLHAVVELRLGNAQALQRAPDERPVLHVHAANPATTRRGVRERQYERVRRHVFKVYRPNNRLPSRKMQPERESSAGYQGGPPTGRTEAGSAGD